MVIDSKSVYWATDWLADGSQSILTMSLDGGPATELISVPSGPYINGLAVNATGLYWADLGGNVYRANLDGTNPSTLATGQNMPGGYFPGGLVADATSVYWVNFAETSASGKYVAGTGAVVKVNNDGSGLTYLASSLDGPKGLVVDGTAVYWMDGDGLEKVGLDGRGMTTVVSSAVASPPPFSEPGLAIDATSAYFFTQSGLASVGLDGQGFTILVPVANVWDGYVAADGDSVYFTEGIQEGCQGFCENLYRSDKSGGCVTLLATSNSYEGFRRLAVNARSLYWVDAGDPAADDGALGMISPK